MITVLNNYACIGGNRKLWKNVNVVAVEKNEEIASEYARLYPQDLIVVGDAHDYLLKNYKKFDFIWSSPPCQSHSKMIGQNIPVRYPDMKLYEEIILLQRYFKGKWVVENVIPYYKPLIRATKIGRHLFWSNYHIPGFRHEKLNHAKVKKEELIEQLGIKLSKDIYFNGNHCPAQIYRQAVLPELGLHVFEAHLKEYNLFA